MDVLNENDRKCDSHFLSNDLLSKSFRKAGNNSEMAITLSVK